MIPYVNNQAPPSQDAGIDELITYYFNKAYTANEIIGFLMFSHGVIISKRTFYRITKRLNLKKRCHENTELEIIRSIIDLHKQGFSEVGYKIMWKLLHVEKRVHVKQETVRLLLSAIDPEGVALRAGRRLRRRKYTTQGPNFIIHIDGYDKLRPYGICIHGAIDGFSRKLVWLEASPSNKNPRIVAGFYLNFIKELKGVPRLVRSDAGNENVIVNHIQVALRSSHRDQNAGFNSFSVGRSTANQRIEMLWSSLKRSFTLYWKNFFLDLIDEGMFNNADPLHIECIRFCFLDLIQRHLDTFKILWNDHRIRSQRNCDVDVGIPNVMFSQPILYDKTDYRFALPCSIETLDRIFEIYADPKPKRGCCDEFLHIVKIATDTEIDDIPLFRDREEGKRMYKVLVDYFATF